MRKKFIAGNWKMNLDRQGCKALAESVKDWVAQKGPNGQVDVSVCPSFVYLATVAEALAGSSIRVGAQDVYCKGNGAPSTRCQKCGYNLTGNVSGVCPECGTSIQKKRFPNRSSWW